MASRHLYRHLVPPSHVPYRPLARLKPSTLLPCRRRPFHTTPKRQSALLDTLTTSTHTLITAVHAAAAPLPWAVALPLTALLLRAAFVLPLSVHVQRHRNRAALAAPLLSAWRPALQRRVLAANARLGPAACQKLLLQEVRRKRKAVYKKLGISAWADFVPLLQLPVWLVAIETIRRMCGAREGLLGMVARGTEGKEVEAGGVPNIPLEPSLAEGGALWFPDLLLPDPLLILPMALGSTLYLNIRLGEKRRESMGLEPSRGQKVLSGVFKGFAVVVTGVSATLPAGMVVYWFASAAGAIGQNLLLDWVMPRPKVPRPCKPAPKSSALEL